MKIGVDLGGTKIEIVALADDGGELIRRRIATPAGDYDAIVNAIGDLVHSVESELDQEATVGIGTPGAIDAQRSWDDYSNGRADAIDQLGALAFHFREGILHHTVHGGVGTEEAALHSNASAAKAVPATGANPTGIRFVLTGEYELALICSS